MDHFELVMELLDAALGGQVQSVTDKSLELKRQLEAAGEHQQARLIQMKLDGVAEELITNSAAVRTGVRTE